MSFLLASSDTKEGLIELINEFYFSSGYTVNEKGEVFRKDGKQMDLVKVEYKRGRYRFCSKS